MRATSHPIRSLLYSYFPKSGTLMTMFFGDPSARKCSVNSRLRASNRDGQLFRSTDLIIIMNIRRPIVGEYGVFNDQKETSSNTRV